MSAIQIKIMDDGFLILLTSIIKEENVQDTLLDHLLPAVLAECIRFTRQQVLNSKDKGSMSLSRQCYWFCKGAIMNYRTRIVMNPEEDY